MAGTEEIPWDNFLVGVGTASGTANGVRMPMPGFVAAHNFDAAPAVASVTAGSEAERAGLAVGDDILEINGFAADPISSNDWLNCGPGDTLHLRVRNSGGERELRWKLGSPGTSRVRVEGCGQHHSATKGSPRGLAQRGVRSVRREPP